MHRFNEYTPIWSRINRLLSAVLALLVLVGGTYLLTLTMRLDGADAEEQDAVNNSTLLPEPTEYDEPNVRIGMCYGSSVRATYAFSAAGQLTYGYNLYESSEFVDLGTVPAGNYKVSIGTGYTVELTVFQDPDTDSTDFNAVYLKAQEILGVYNLPIFPMLTENGMAVCIGMFDTEEEAASQAEFMYIDLGMDFVFGGDADVGDGGDITEGDITDEVTVITDEAVTDDGTTTEDGTVSPDPEPEPEIPLYMEFGSRAFSATDSLVLYDSAQLPVYAYDGPNTSEKRMAVRTDFEEGAYLVVESKYYESFFEFRHYKSSSANGVSVVTVLPLERYVMGVLSEELYTSWDHEAQKVFSVLIRSYAVSGWNKHSGYGFNLCNNTNCQVYEGCRKINDNVRTAVEETKGVILTDNGKLASVYYATVGGGVTVNSEDSWTSSRTYLKAVPTPWERYRDYSKWTSGGVWHVEMTGDELYQQLAPSYPTLKGTIVDAKIDSFCTNSSYVLQITFTDKYGNSVSIRKADTIRNRLGLKSGNFVIGRPGQTVQVPVYELDCYPSVYNENRLMQTYYPSSAVSFESFLANGSSMQISGVQSIVDSLGEWLHDLSAGETEIVASAETYKVNESGLPDILNAETVMYYDTVTLEQTSSKKDVFIIEGKGYGHGIGICQYGAWDLASAGYDYLTILQYYFKDVAFGKVTDFLK